MQIKNKVNSNASVEMLGNSKNALEKMRKGEKSMVYVLGKQKESMMEDELEGGKTDKNDGNADDLFDDKYIDGNDNKTPGIQNNNDNNNNEIEDYY